jgi:N-acetylglucosamine kinase-like BadF-type ATPase
MDIGRDALMLSVRMADGRDRDTILRDTLWNALHVRRPEELKAMVVRDDFGPAGFARLAPLVDQLAQNGDLQAQSIVRKSATGLVDLVVGVAQALNLTNPAVAATGGAITHLPSLRGAWSTDLAVRLPGAVVVTPDQDACHGALMMAIDLMGPTGSSSKPPCSPAI